MEDALSVAGLDPGAYPLWVLFSPAVLKESRSVATALPVWKTLEGERYAPVFTDKDLAQRFLEEQQVVGVELMPVEDLARLCHILRLYRNKGVPSVGTDFSTKQLHHFPQQGQLHSIDVILRAFCGGDPQ